MKADRKTHWLELTAYVLNLIGIAGIIAIMIRESWAADPPGTNPGGKTFTNPFANVNPGAPPGKSGFFDEEDDEEPDFTEDSRSFPPGGNPSGGFEGSQNPGGSDKGGVSMGGSSSSGVISHNKVNPLRVDDETGDGSREVVTDFNFPDADILDIAKTLGKLAGKNFIFDKDVKGRISIVSNSPITVGDAWKAFLTALDMNGFALIPSGKYIRIARQRDARDKQLKTYTGDYSPDTDALITRVFPLKYISAEEVARTFRSFMPANSRIIPYEQTNTVIVTDTGANIAKLSKMLEILDIEGYDAGIEVIPVKFASAVELSKLIDSLVPGTSTGGGGPPGGAPRFGGAGKFNARRTKEGGIINNIIADERTNTLIIHANGKGADQVRELVAKLDQKVPLAAGGGKVHVVYLQFADAEQIGNTLNNLSQGSGFKPVAGPPGAGGTGVNPVTTSLFEGSIKISPDKSTNSLVITASPADFATVQRVINRLDIPRDEVYVEVIVMEVAIQRNFEWSSNVINPASGLASITRPEDLLAFATSPLSGKGAIISFPYGSTRQVPGPGGQVSVPGLLGLIKAIQTDSKANILATPQIIALDNEDATFSSVEKIPVLTAVATQGVSQQSTSKENVELSIKIKPQINKLSNFIKLKVTAKIEDIEKRDLPAAVQSLAFATLNRSAETTVSVGDSDTVVLGGLMRDKVSEATSKIPILGDIPLLGWLFKSKTTEVAKTNLLIFMTPHILRQYEKVRAVLDKKLKERDEFIESQAGGEDPLRNARDDMIRSLPDVHELAAQKPKASVQMDEDKPLTPAETNSSPEQGASAGGGAKPAAPQPPLLGAPPAADGFPPSIPPPSAGHDHPPSGTDSGGTTAPPPAPPTGGN